MLKAQLIYGNKIKRYVHLAKICVYYTSNILYNYKLQEIQEEFITEM